MARVGLLALDRAEVETREVDLSRTEFGSIEGEITETTTYYGTPAIKVQERLNGWGVTCIFSSELAEKARHSRDWDEVWSGRKILIRGRISYDRLGHLFRVHAENIQDVGAARPLTYQDIADPTFTNGLTPQDHIESIWVCVVANSATKIYWDSCAWIGFINDEANKRTPLRVIWEDAKRGLYEIWTSSFTYLEVIHGKNAHGEPYPPSESDLLVFEMLNQPFVVRVQLDVEVAKLARNLRRNHNDVLKKRSDAIHLATALYWNILELHTWEKSDLLPIDGRVQCNNGASLKICIPGPEVHGELFAVRFGGSRMKKNSPLLSQPDSFVETARKIECDADEARFNEKLGNIAKIRPLAERSHK
jgi:predicted nucleic acid-binding protein